MRRLILFLLTAITAVFPPSLLLVFVSSNLLDESISNCKAPSVSLVSSSTKEGLRSQLHATQQGPKCLPLRLPLSMSETLKASLSGSSERVDPACSVEFKNTDLSSNITIFSVHIGSSIIFPIQSVKRKAPYPFPQPPLLFFRTDVLSSVRNLHLKLGSTVTLPVSMCSHLRKNLKSTTATFGKRTTFIYQNHPPKATVNDALASIKDQNRKDIFVSNSNSYNITVVNDEAIRIDRLKIIEITRTKLPLPIDDHDSIPMCQIYKFVDVNTSLGIFHVKLPHLCSQISKEFGYGLHNNVIFVDGAGGLHSGRISTQKMDIMNHKKIINAIKKIAHCDSFSCNTCLNNPSSVEERKVWEIFINKPDIVLVHVKLTSNRYTYYPVIGVHNPLGKRNVFVATVQMLPHRFYSTSITLLFDITYSTLRTSMSSLSIVLDFIPNSEIWGILCGPGIYYSTIGIVGLVNDHSMTDMASQIESYLFVGAFNRTWSQFKSNNETMIGERRHKFEKKLPSKEMDSVFAEGHSAGKVPKGNDFRTNLIASITISLSVPLLNIDNRPIRLMKTLIPLNMLYVLEVSAYETHVFDMGVDFFRSEILPIRNLSAMLESYHEIIIHERNALQYPLYVWRGFIVSKVWPVVPLSHYCSITLKVTEYSIGVKWKHQYCSGNIFSQKFVAVISIKISDLLRNYMLSTASITFRIFFSSLSRKDRSLVTVVRHFYNMKRPCYFNPFLKIESKLFSITLQHLRIGNSFDYKFYIKHISIPLDQSSNAASSHKFTSHIEWKDISVRIAPMNNLIFFTSPKKGIYWLETYQAGNQSWPLIVFSEEHFVAMQNLASELTNENCSDFTNDSFSIASEKNYLHHRIQTSVEGEMLHDSLTDLNSIHKHAFISVFQCATIPDPTESYFHSFVIVGHTINDLQPFNLKSPAVGTEQVVTKLLFLTKMSALVDDRVQSITITNINATVEYILSSIDDMVEQVHRKDKVNRFFRKSVMDTDFLPKLMNEVGITFSPHANRKEIHSILSAHTIAQSLQMSSEFVFNEMLVSREHDKEYCFGIVLSTEESLRIEFLHRRARTKKWWISPRGVIPFVVSHTTPSSTKLRNHITSFLSTSSVFEVICGLVFPIVTTYSTLIGQLRVKLYEVNKSAVMETLEQNRMPRKGFVISVHGHKSIENNTPQLESDHNSEVPNIVYNSSNQIFLEETKSCNRVNVTLLSKPKAPLCSVRNRSRANYSFEGSLVSHHTSASFHVRHTTSTVSWSHFLNDYSFLYCALEWLKDKDQIQPTENDLFEEKIMVTLFSTDNLSSKVPMKKSQAIHAFADEMSYVSGGHVFKTGRIVIPSDINLKRSALSAWASFGFNIISSYVSAFAVNCNPDLIPKRDLSILLELRNLQKNNTRRINYLNSSVLPLPQSSVLAAGPLEPPHFFTGKRKHNICYLDFETTHVGETSSLYVPLFNPTDVTISVYLFSTSSIDENNLFIKTTAGESHPWWTVPSYWMSDKDGQLISASHNVTFMSGTGAFLSLINPALHSMSAFLLGCGRRCGQNIEDNAGHWNLYSTVGSASGSKSSLLGTPWHKIKKQNNFNENLLPPSFALGHYGMKHVVIPPHSKAHLGPVVFRPPGRGEFTSTIYISNNLTGFEELEVRGRGVWGKLVFIDDDIEFRHGRSTLMFPRDTHTTEGGPPFIKSFVLANLGDIPIHIKDVYMASSEMKYFSHRNLHPSSFFRPYSLLELFLLKTTNHHLYSKCSALQFNLLGCEQVHSERQWIKFLPSWFSTKIVFFQTKFRSHKAPTSANNSSSKAKLFENNFTVLPNENRTFFVEHRPDCVSRASYASIIFEINDRNVATVRTQHTNTNYGTFQDTKLELLVGYNMDTFEKCMPYSPSREFMLEKNIMFVIIMDIMSFGLFRLRDKVKKSFIPQFAADVSYIMVIFIIFLTIFALDLMLSTRFPCNYYHQFSNWKQTCRCLSHADPMSADLITLGQEQTKHVLHSRLRRCGIFQPCCLSLDGNFTRERLISPRQPRLDGESIGHLMPNRRILYPSQHANMLSPAAFCHLTLLLKDVKSSDPQESRNSEGLLPCRFSWRAVELRRITASQFQFIGSHVTNPESGNPARSSRSAIESEESSMPGHDQMVIESKYSASEFTKNVNITSIPDEQIEGNSLVPSKNGTNKMKHNIPSRTEWLPAMVEIKNSVFPVPKEEATHSIDPLLSPKISWNRECTSTNDADISLIDNVKKSGTVKIDSNNSRKKVPSHGRMKHEMQLVIKKDIEDRHNDREQTRRRQENRMESHISAPYNRTDFYSKVNQNCYLSKLAEIRPSSFDKSEHASDSVTDPQVKQEFFAQAPNIDTFISTMEMPRSSIMKTNACDNAKNVESSSGVSAPTKRSNYIEVSLSSTQESSSDTIYQTPIQSSQRKLLRPPPGLPPPPGFLDQSDLNGQISPLFTETGTPLLSPQSLCSPISPTKAPLEDFRENAITDSPLLLSRQESMSFPNDLPTSQKVESLILIDELLASTLAPPFHVSSETPESPLNTPDFKTLLGSSSSFNVSSFLQGIIHEDLTEKNTTLESEALHQAPSIRVPLDPWNAVVNMPKSDNLHDTLNGRSSDMECTLRHGQVEQRDVGVPFNINSLFVFSPPTIQKKTMTMDPTYARLINEVAEEDNDSFLEPDSFYNHLLEEE